VRIVEIDPSVADFVVLNFHNRATVIASLAPGGRNVGQRAEVGSARAPADDHMVVASGKDLLDIEVRRANLRGVVCGALPLGLFGSRWEQLPG